MPEIALIIHIILFATVIILMAVIYPIMGYSQGKQFKTILSNGKYNKVDWYRNSILWSWLPTLIIVPIVIITGQSFIKLGFRLPSAQINNVSPTFFYIALVLSAIYLLYNLYCMLSFRFNNRVREQHVQKTPLLIKSILPVTKQEKKMWTLLAITAGVTEELLYRGYLFFALFFLFKEIHPASVIAFSTLLFAIGHIYQGKEVIKPALAGLFLCLVYYFTGSIYVVIILHIMQDLVAKDLLKND